MTATTIEAFHRQFYASGVWEDTTWMGVPIAKAPSDMIAYAEILHATGPDLLIETGSWYGGSALYFAHLFDLIGHGRVVSIDVAKADRPRHPRVTYATGSSTDPDAVTWIHSEAKDRRTMVVLDSDHHKRHVLAELEAYAPLVSVGHYLVVEDTNMNGRPVNWKQGAGPGEAVDAWLPDHPEFVCDERPERFMLTFQPGGWLRRET